MSRLSPPPRWGWPVAAGVVLALAYPPFHLVAPSFLGLVPWVVWLAGLPEGQEGRSQALRGGFLMGLLHFSLVFYWLLVALVFYTPLAVLAFGAPVLVMAGFLSCATLGVHLTTRRLNWPLWLAVPVFWTAMEWVRAHLGPVAFPWMELGASLTGVPRLIGAADLVGTRGLSFWLAAVNALIAAVLLRRWPGLARVPLRETASAFRRDRAAAPGPAGGRALVVAALVTFALPVAYSLVRWHGLETRPAARAGVIQPNVPEDIKLQHEAAADSARASTERLLGAGDLAGEAAGGIDLLVLPETVIPLYVEAIPELDYPGRPEWRRWIRSLARRTGAKVLYGAMGADADPGAGDGDGLTHYNSAYLLAPGAGPVGRYDKRYLVPLVERVPFLPPEWFEGVAFMGGFGEGEWTEPFRADGSTFGVLICYESIFADRSRRYRRAGADFLVNITNDAWFGRHRPWWARTSALWQHPAHVVMRAVENRMGVVRAANTGISGVVDPRGRFERRTPLFQERAFTATVTTTDEKTLFTRWGDWVGGASILGAALAMIVTGLRPRIGLGGGET